MEHDVSGVHRLNLIVYNLMYVYEFRLYAEIYSIASCFLPIKGIGDKDFSKIFNFSISALIYSKLSSSLKLPLSKVNYTNQVSVFYINNKTKLVETFCDTAKKFY